MLKLFIYTCFFVLLLAPTAQAGPGDQFGGKKPGCKFNTFTVSIKLFQLQFSYSSHCQFCKQFDKWYLEFDSYKLVHSND